MRTKVWQCYVRSPGATSLSDTSNDEIAPIQQESDILWIRQLVQEYAAELGFNSLDQTKLVTAASELSRNTLIHGGGGEMIIAKIQTERQRGLRMIFEDRGPGIKDIDQALTDGFTTGEGMGLGLGGAKRLVNEFEVAERDGGGTIITVTRWA